MMSVGWEENDMGDKSPKDREKKKKKAEKKKTEAAPVLHVKTEAKAKE